MNDLQEIDFKNSGRKILVPLIITASGEDTSTRFKEFFFANIANENTREAYGRAIEGFFKWMEQRDKGDILDIETLDIAAWARSLEQKLAVATVQQRLAAVKSLFNWFVRHQILSVSPAATVKVKSERLRHGKTKVLSSADARRLLDTIQIEKTKDGASVPIHAGLRDRALISLMIYTFARVSAAVQMNVSHVYEKDHRLWVDLQEKGGKHLSIPCHHILEQHLRAYIDVLGEGDPNTSPLFCAMDKSRQLTSNRLDRTQSWHMVRRRARQAKISADICNHTFRGTGISSYLRNKGGRLEIAQHLAGHSDPKTTQLYDRRDEDISLDEVERIDI
ncbi:MAG: tyrosine-type recombinase/integrase [Kordiimonadaceae bacterium]|nr:tyrosine-type recombinase/integrase [Kordiimonadaceae bacterium]